ncbi:glycosyltransferase family 88 protein [Legionella fallonii]|uniref:Lgt1 glycosyltransferase domain-containing protein n=1 Tax=Legionella fallonii LLAP-10 TaxID=1212491 RepID=A0A098G279_9GAMM|nr:glycosyltransferase family 88 protein [Legionella fallonii]CEG56091.1 conserved protein of unknown function [Legionella fallonii LLAP-10]
MPVLREMYQYNPHHHVKIWLSNKPAVFMNTENKMRLIEMRELNPKDVIHLVYDSSLLNTKALDELAAFCKEHAITPVDANSFEHEIISEKEKKLFKFYKDEINNLNDGGNLAVASDILRWLYPVYSKGGYTDFDVPVDTSALPETVNVHTPLLLNIGSLRTRNKDVILSNNDYIAVVDPEAAKEEIEKVQEGVISVLQQYDNDFIEKTIEEFGRDSFINQYLIQFMKNRSESIYIARSKSEFPAMGSRQLRSHINQIMTNPEKFLEFAKKGSDETDKEVILRLRKELNEQLGFFKWLFFRSEYNEIKNALQQSDDDLIAYLMKKERTLYLKSIVVCTTGPIAIAKFLFDGYVFNSDNFDEEIAPYSFNSYGLKSAFQSKNTISMNESIWGMMNFLGSEEGALNDSSWLETGAQLQKSRAELLDERRNQLRESLPQEFKNFKKNIEEQIQQLEENSKGFWGLFFADRKREKIKALQAVLTCYNGDSFDTNKFREVLNDIQPNIDMVYAGWFSHKTQDLIEGLKALSHQSIVFMLTQERQIDLKPQASTAKAEVVSQENKVKQEKEPYHGGGLNFFPQATNSGNPEEVLRPQVGLAV